MLFRSLTCFHCKVKKCNCAISHTNPSLTRMRIPLPCCFAQVQWLSWTRSRRSSMRSSWPRTWTCQPSCRSTRSSALPTTSAPCSTSPARPRSADIWLAIAFGRGCLSILFLVVSLRFAPVFLSDSGRMYSCHILCVIWLVDAECRIRIYDHGRGEEAELFLIRLHV